MKRDVEWVEKLEDGIRRTVRVKFVSGGRLKWQFKRSDHELWDYDSLPTAEDWETLESKVSAFYFRRRAPLKDLELVQNLRKSASKGE